MIKNYLLSYKKKCKEKTTKKKINKKTNISNSYNSDGSSVWAGWAAALTKISGVLYFKNITFIQK